MALWILDFEHKYLNGITTISIILPNRPRNVSPAEYYSSEKYKVLWLRHGTFGDRGDTWIRPSCYFRLPRKNANQFSPAMPACSSGVYPRRSSSSRNPGTWL